MEWFVLLTYSKKVASSLLRSQGYPCEVCMFSLYMLGLSSRFLPDLPDGSRILSDPTKEKMAEWISISLSNFSLRETLSLWPKLTLLTDLFLNIYIYIYFSYLAVGRRLPVTAVGQLLPSSGSLRQGQRNVWPIEDRPCHLHRELLSLGPTKKFLRE